MVISFAVLLWKTMSMFTSLDTVKVLLDVLEEITIGVSTIDA